MLNNNTELVLPKQKNSLLDEAKKMLKLILCNYVQGTKEPAKDFLSYAIDYAAAQIENQIIRS